MSTRPDLKRAKGEDVGALFGLARPLHMPRDATLPGKASTLLQGKATPRDLNCCEIHLLNLDKLLDFIPGDSCSQPSLFNGEDGCTCPQ